MNTGFNATKKCGAIFGAIGTLASDREEAEKASSRKIELVRSVLEALYSSSTTGNILDLGCGIGRFAPIFISLGFDYTGVDVSPVAIAQARKSCPEAKFVEGIITEYEPDQKYDLIFVSYVLIHILRDRDWLHVLDTVKRSLKSDGLFFLMESIPDVRKRKAIFVTRTKDEYDTVLADRNMCFDGKTSAKLNSRFGSHALQEFHFIRNRE